MKDPTRLLQAVRDDDIELIRALLIEGYDVNARGYEQLTPLYYASQRGNPEIVRLLLEAGADPDGAWRGSTPIHVATKHGHIQVVEALLDDGADVDAKLIDGATALFVAAQYGHTEVLKILLVSGADVTVAQKDGATPLHIAAKKGHQSAVVLLLEHGACPGTLSRLGKTAIDLARESGDARLASVIENWQPKASPFSSSPTYHSPEQTDTADSPPGPPPTISQPKISSRVLNEGVACIQEHIDFQERLRPMLGNAMVDAAIGLLSIQLRELRALETHSAPKSKNEEEPDQTTAHQDRLIITEAAETAVVHTLVEVAMADELFLKSEHNALLKFFSDELGYPQEELSRIRAKVAVATADWVDPKTLRESLSSLSSYVRERIYGAALEIAYADDELRPSEVERLRELEELLEVSSERALALGILHAKISEQRHRSKSKSQEGVYRVQATVEFDPQEAQADSPRRPVTHDTRNEFMGIALTSRQWETLTNDLTDFEGQVLASQLRGMSYKQMADRFDRSVKAIDNTLQRIKKKAKKLAESA